MPTFTDLHNSNPATALTGAEFFGADQGGQTVGVTGVQIAALVNSAPAIATQVAAATAQATIATTQAGIASTQAGLAATQVVAVTAAASSASASATNSAAQVLAALGIKNNLGTSVTAGGTLPNQVLNITGGGGTGGTPGTYTGSVSGTPFPGFQWQLIVGSNGIGVPQIVTNGLSTSSTVPTLVLPTVIGLTGATTPIVTVGAIPSGVYFTAPDAARVNALAWGNNAGVLAAAPFGGTQISLPATSQYGYDTPIVLAPAGWLTINLVTGNVSTASGTAYTVHSAGYAAVTASQSVAITGFSNPLAIQTIYVNMATGAIGGVQTGAVPANCLAVAAVFNGTLYPAASYSLMINPFLLVDSSGTTAFTGNMQAAAVTGPAGFVTVNLQTGQVLTSSGTGYIAYAGGYKQVNVSQTVAITGFSSATSLHAIYVNMATGAIGGVQLTAYTVPVNCIPIAYVFNGNLYPVLSGGGSVYPFSLINSSGGTVLATPQPFALIFDIGALNLSLVSGNFTVTGGAVYLSTSSGLITITNQTVALGTQTGAGALYCSPSGALAYVNNGPVPVGSYPIMSVKLNPTSGLDCAALAFGQNVSFTDANGYTTLIGAQQGLKPFFSPNDRLILPDDFFFISGHVQPLVRNSYLCEPDMVLAGSTDVFLDTATDGDSPVIALGKITNVDPSTLTSGTALVVAMKNATDQHVYTQSIMPHIAPSGALTSSSPKILCIGDSMMMFGMLRAYQDQFTALGATPSFLGTFNSVFGGVHCNPSSGSGDILGEGRGSWAYRSFTGRDTQAGGNTMTLATGSSTTQFQNPFLRVATSTDKTNNPTWCYAFGNSSTYKNPSYVENASLGTYYIFDFANYLSVCGVSTPDIVTVALGFNDLNFGGNSSPYTQAQQISEAVIGLNIMVRQIRTACPSAKIVITAFRSVASDNAHTSQWFSTYQPLIEAIQTQFRALKTAGITGIYLVGTYAHTNRDYGYSLTSGGAITAANAEVVNTIADPVHWTMDATQVPGKKRVARTEVAAIACALAGV